MNLHLSKVKPSFASILKRGTPSAPPTRRYALAAAKLSSIPPHPLAPTKKKHTPPKRKTLDIHKLYLDSAATYHSVFVKWYLKNIRDTGRVLRRNCNAGVRSCTQVGDLGIFEMWINEG